MGKMGSDLMEISKKIAVIRHVGIRKTKLISSPLNDGISNDEVLAGDNIEPEDATITDELITESSDDDNVTEVSSISSSSNVAGTSEIDKSELSDEQQSSSTT